MLKKTLTTTTTNTNTAETLGTVRGESKFRNALRLVLNGKSSSGKLTPRTRESEQLVGHPRCAVWTAGWKADTVVGLGTVSPTRNKRKTCFSSPQTVTNVSVCSG